MPSETESAEFTKTNYLTKMIYFHVKGTDVPGEFLEMGQINLDWMSEHEEMVKALGVKNE